MADKRSNRGAPGSNNLLFSTGELSFTVPFIPVTGPLPAGPDEAVEVGEEDSFLGQTSGVTGAPQTFSYFSQASCLSSGDPFAGITQTPTSSPAALSRPPSAPPPSSIQNGQHGASTPHPAHQYPSSTLPFPSSTSTLPFPSSTSTLPFPSSTSTLPFPSSTSTLPFPSSTSTLPFPSSTSTLPFPSSTLPAQSPPAGPPPSTFSPPPISSPGAPYNPYRHNPQSSRANPYLTPPQLQQEHATGASPFTPHHYQTGSPTPAPPAPAYMTAVTAPPPGTRPAPPPLLAPPPFMPNLYEAVQHHWFFCRLVEGREVWAPFSMYDSSNLEEVYNSVQPDPESVMVRTAGGRYDVCLYDREMSAIYWEEETAEVRRCSWFYKGDTDSRYVPYSEDFSERLEAEYKKAVLTGQWHRKLEFPGGETIVMHNPKVIVQFQQSSIPDEWGTPQDGQARPRVVKRGIDDHDDVPEGELPQADHLVFMVHGIGPVCDLRFRSMVECVDDFRSVSLKLLQTHFRKSVEEGKVRRVEFLPVHWHSALHGDATGVDRLIKKISLPSIGRLRHFTNETLLDILFYNSPTYCQTIVDKVASEMNRLYQLFLSRNPDFRGSVSVAGHSLGSLILFDILSNQQDLSASPPTQIQPADVTSALKPEAPLEKADSAGVEPGPSDLSQEGLPELQDALESLGLSEYTAVFDREKIDLESLLMCTIEDLKEMGIPLGPRKKLAKYVKETAANQIVKRAATAQKVALSPPDNGNAISDHSVSDGSNPEPPKRKLPVGASVSSIHVNYEHFDAGTGQVCVRYNSLDFQLENFFALGSPIGIFLTVRGVNAIDANYRLPTCKGFFNIYHPLDPVAYRLEPMIVPDVELKPVLIPHHKGRKRLHLELKESLSRMGSDLKQGFISSLRSAWQTLNEFARFHTSSAQLQAELEKVADQIKEEEDNQAEVDKLESPEICKEEDLTINVGMLNCGRRIDYVLQEKPLESFNEYLFALQSHLCYWESEDTALLILKEIYKSLHIHPDQMLH